MPDEDRTVWFEGSQMADPSAANPETQKKKWPQATGGCADTCQHAACKCQFRICIE